MPPSFYDKGYVTIGGATIKSWKKGGHGLQTYLEVLQNSSNPGFVSIARKLGKDNLYNYINAFGFGKKTGVDMYGETNGIMFKYDSYNELEQATSAFGQGISVSMIQMATAYSAVINGGYLLQPYILKDIRTTNSNEVVYQNNSKVVRQVISENTSKLMRDALEHVASLGSGRTAYIDGYRVGGKTGTAQKSVNGYYLVNNYKERFDYLVERISVNKQNSSMPALFINTSILPYFSTVKSINLLISLILYY